jgi:hypothetical protein
MTVERFKLCLTKSLSLFFTVQRCFQPDVIANATRKNKSSEFLEGSQSFNCPFCESGLVSGIYLFPLCLEDLEKSIDLRQSNSTIVETKKMAGEKRSRVDSSQTNDEIGYLVYSRWRTSAHAILGSNDQHRTGRWTDEEMAYVDHLLQMFSDGKIPIADGVKLNTLLCDLLLCKSSRLTKKMKNAKLSTRSFKLVSNPGEMNMEDCQILSALQNSFLKCQSNEIAKLELAFNVTKQWRLYFSNFCLQAGYLHLDAKEWISSVEELERRASVAEEKVRQIRRRTMGLALRNEDSHQSSSASFASTVAMEELPRYETSQGSKDYHRGSADSAVAKDILAGEPQFRRRTFSDDFDAILKDLQCEETDSASPTVSIVPSGMNPPGLVPIKRPPVTFVDALTMILETPNCPYQHADIWVPSFAPNDSTGEKIQLLHAGNATRRNQPQNYVSSLKHFGEYSKSFTFQPGEGLPGRVYSSGEVSWDLKLFSLDPKHFARSAGANVYGVKTATGIPLNAQGVGRIVVVLYSYNDLVEDTALANEYTSELAKYSPQPKWKVVIDINEAAAKKPRSSPTGESSAQLKSERNIDSYSHPLLETAGIMTPVFTHSEPPRASEKSSQDMNPLSLSGGEGKDTTEEEIISLLGHEAANFHSMAVAKLSSSPDPDNLLPQYISIRLLLLRPPSKRSSAENEMIDVLKSSYQSYTHKSSRSRSELAKLLSRDWSCLKKSARFPTADSGLTGIPNSTAIGAIGVSLPSITLVVPDEGGEKNFPIQPPSIGTLTCDPAKVQSFRHVSIGVDNVTD